MTTLTLLALGALLSVGGCVSNPTPHPSQFDAYREGEVKVDFDEVPNYNQGGTTDGAEDAETSEPTTGLDDALNADDNDTWVDDNDTLGDDDAWIDPDGYEVDGEAGPLPGESMSQDSLEDWGR